MNNVTTQKTFLNKKGAYENIILKGCLYNKIIYLTAIHVMYTAKKRQSKTDK